jgi:hypothetical protein
LFFPAHLFLPSVAHSLDRQARFDIQYSSSGDFKRLARSSAIGMPGEKASRRKKNNECSSLFVRHQRFEDSKDQIPETVAV